MSGAALRLSCAQVSDIGMRAENEDYIGMTRHGTLACFVVADGTGGHAGGAVASKLVVDAMLGAFDAAPVCDSGALRAGVAAASARVAMARRASPALSDMSSTVAAVIVDEAAAQTVWAHLGDTRVYLFRTNRLLAVTLDHSLARQLLDSGLGSVRDVRVHPQRHILLAAVGAENDTVASTSDGAVALQAGDALLLCTDGLWEWLTDAQMATALAATSTCDAWLMAMCDVAAAAASTSVKDRDNFSACAIRVHAAGETT
ncbi:MAG: protein phosphatase 2C domain-containing protein [Pseudomonadota bacterium]|nr:protein phosphatase 2C domain-containing protein [Pseudomonadota bacterium]